MTFALEVFQNKFLPPGQGRVDAILSVKAGDEVGRADEALVVGFILDKSGSMEGERLEAVKAAVERGLGSLDERTVFFIVAFDGQSVVVAPAAPATEANRRRAAGLLRALSAAGGTAISAGLRAARELFERFPHAIRRAIFLTDGKNESDKAETLRAELARSARVFECDGWGVGTDWKVNEVRAVTEALHGKASLIPSPAGIDVAFRDALARAGQKALRSVRLRLWTPVQAHLVALKQVNPTLVDLTPKGQRVSPQLVDFDTGSWAKNEVREFQLTVEVPPDEAGNEVLVARPSLQFQALVEGAWVEHEIKPPEARIFATWTDDHALSSRLDRHVAHYQGQDALADAIETGLSRRALGDDQAASALLGKAVRLAQSAGDVAMTDRLKQVVDIIDPVVGTVQLRRDVHRAAEMELQLESRTTRRAPGEKR